MPQIAPLSDTQQIKALRLSKGLLVTKASSGLYLSKPLHGKARAPGRDLVFIIALPGSFPQGSLKSLSSCVSVRVVHSHVT